MRQITGLISIVLILWVASVVFAQDDAPSATQPAVQQALDAAERAERFASQAATAAADAEEAAAKSDRDADLAFNLFGLFEVFGGVLTIFAIAGGAYVVNRWRNLQQEMVETRERFEKEIVLRQHELDELRDELKRDSNALRQETERSSLAMSLLPLGERQYKAQDFEGALDTYRRALELDPNNLIIHYRLGYVHTQRGNLEQAEEHLMKALELEEDFAPALASLGYVYRRIGESMEEGDARDRMLNKAEGLLLRALEIQPKMIDEDDESWWGSLGGLYRRREQIDAAIRAYEKAAEVTPHSSYPFSNLALLYVQKGEREKMQHTYKRVEQLAWGEVQAEVDNYWAYADLLTSRLAQGKVAEAESVLEMVFDIAPADSPYVFSMLADTLTRLANVLEEEQAKPVRDVIAKIQAFDEKRKQV